MKSPNVEKGKVKSKGRWLGLETSTHPVVGTNSGEARLELASLLQGLSLSLEAGG